MSWPGWARWAASVLLISWLVSLTLSACLSLVALYEVGSNPFADAGLSVLSIGGAVLIRLHWQALRSWNTRSEAWTRDHPAGAMGLYALVGMFLVSLSLGLSFVNLAVGAASGCFMGWLHLRLDRSRRGDPAT